MSLNSRFNSLLMKKCLLHILLLLLPGIMMAQFSAISGLSYDYGKDKDIDGIDAVVVLEKVDATAGLRYVFEDSVQSEWYYHTVSSDSLIVSSVVNDTVTTLDSLQQGVYELRLKDSVSFYYYVVDFSEYQPIVDSVWVDDSGDSCNCLDLYATLDRPDIPVYDYLNDSTHVLQKPTTVFLWSDDEVEDESPIKMDAPLEDVSYLCMPYSDDFFDDNDLVVEYPSPDTVYSDYYTAIAVNITELEATIPDEEDDNNLTETSSTTEGSAPLNVTYTITSEGAVVYIDWYIWDLEDDQTSSILAYKDQETITHSFKSYTEDGYRVKVAVGNDYCQATDSAEVMVRESDLQAPNILVLGFGAEGKFKVAYQSIDPSTFRAAIYSRNGRLIYKWDDPDGGWDGRNNLTGAYVNPGAYYYSIQARGTDGEKYKLIGDVNVIREKGM